MMAGEWSIQLSEFSGYDWNRLKEDCPREERKLREIQKAHDPSRVEVIHNAHDVPFEAMLAMPSGNKIALWQRDTDLRQ